MTHTTTTHCTTLQQARAAAQRGASWFLRLEFYGYNAENKSGHSEKFWQLEGNGGLVTRRWGRFGTKGQTKADNMYSGLEKAAEKLASGYRPVAGR